jgi:soluble lytic murein transglycosylase-like protein
MRAAVGGAVVLGMMAGTLAGVACPADAADIFLLRDRKGVLHITNAPVDPGNKLAVREPPAVRPAAVVGNKPANRNRVMLPLIDPGLVPMPVLPRAVAVGPRQPSLPPAPPSAPTQYDEAIRIIADGYDVEYALVKAVIKAESGFNHLAVSPKGAQGLMQLMPATAAEVQVQDAFSPQENIAGGVKYLRQMLDRYAGNLALAVAAYNAGPTRVDQAGGIPDIAETREYVAKVLRYRLGYLREGAGVRQARR